MVWFTRDIELTLDGIRFAACIEHDTDMGPPWEEHDGHGPVSPWTTRAKRPGELVLSTDRDKRRFYDFAAGCRIALSDGWNAKPYDVPGETKRQRAAKAARADFEYLRGWCRGDWRFVGVRIRVIDEHDQTIRGTESALWGIESSDPSYLDEVAEELARGILLDCPYLTNQESQAIESAAIALSLFSRNASDLTPDNRS